jgi:hypothetical protein
MMPECSESESLRFYTLDEKTLTPTLLRALPTEGHIVDTVVLSLDENKLTLLGCKEDPANPKKTSLICLSLTDLENGEPEYISLPEEYSAPSLLLRNGGPIISGDKTKIRILQESTETEYGHNLIFRSIVNDGLNGGKFEETDIAKVGLDDLPISLPSSYRRQGTHTYSLGEKFEVVDVSFNRFHIGNMTMK